MKALTGVIIVIALGVSACSRIDTARLELIALDPGLAQDSGEPMAEVLEYWALEGTLESVGVEEGWLCPSRGNVGFSAVIEPSEVPQAFKLILPDRQPSLVLNRDSGPRCIQPHLLVMLAPARTETGSGYSAGMTVWPQTRERSGGWGGGTAEDLIINLQPARLHIGSDGHTDAWWSDGSGTRMYAETYGLPRDRVLDLIAAIDVDPSVHRATIDPESLRDLEVVSNQASTGSWASGLRRSALYRIDESEISVYTSYDATFDPLARFAPFIWTAELVDVDGIPAVWLNNGAEYAGLEFTTGDGIHVFIFGPLTASEAVALAEQLG